MIRSQPRNLHRATELYLELPTLCLYLPATKAFLSPEVQSCSHYLSSKTCCSSCILYPANRICLWRASVKNLSSPTTLSHLLHPVFYPEQTTYCFSTVLFCFVLMLCSCFSLYLEYLQPHVINTYLSFKTLLKNK